MKDKKLLFASSAVLLMVVISGCADTKVIQGRGYGTAQKMGMGVPASSVFGANGTITQRAVIQERNVIFRGTYTWDAKR